MQRGVHEARKVQTTGKSTHIVSLPKKWVDRVRLRGGDTVFLVPRSDGSLLVQPQAPGAAAHGGSLVVDVTGLVPAAARRRIVAAYLTGATSIELRSKPALDRTVADGVRAAARQLVGVQIVEEGTRIIRVEVLGDRGDFGPIHGARRLFTLGRHAHLAALGSARHVAGDENLLAEVDRIRWLVARQCNLVLRDVFVGDRLGLHPSEAPGILRVIRVLARFAARAAEIAPAFDLAINALRPTDRLRHLATAAVAAMEEAMAAFQYGPPERLDRVGGRVTELRALAESLRADATQGGQAALAQAAVALHAMLRDVLEVAEAADEQCLVRGSMLAPPVGLPL